MDVVQSHPDWTMTLMGKWINRDKREDADAIRQRYFDDPLIYANHSKQFSCG